MFLKIEEAQSSIEAMSFEDLYKNISAGRIQPRISLHMILLFRHFIFIKSSCHILIL